jgi:hypothetical protein
MFLDYDPTTGVRHDMDYDPETGRLDIHYRQNVQGLLDRTKLLRDNGLTDQGIKGGFWHYASIPTTVQIELLNKGLDLFKANDFPRLLEEINTNYPYLKVSEKNHGGKVKEIYLGKG